LMRIVGGRRGCRAGRPGSGRGAMLFASPRASREGPVARCVSKKKKYAGKSLNVLNRLLRRGGG